MLTLADIIGVYIYFEIGRRKGKGGGKGMDEFLCLPSAIQHEIHNQPPSS